jgi:TIR domain
MLPVERIKWIPSVACREGSQTELHGPPAASLFCQIALILHWKKQRYWSGRMVDTQQSPVNEQILREYEKLIRQTHPDRVQVWPLISGHDTKIGQYKGWVVVAFHNTRNSGMTTTDGLGELSRQLIGFDQITPDNRRTVRKNLERHFLLSQSDAVVLVDAHGRLFDELEIMKRRHECSMGLTPMKIFLSHKGADKPLVREFKNALGTLGFDPWLDEEAMPAGTNLERGIKKGFKDSCAAIFFITSNYKDENYLATEIDYAIQEARAKGDQFSIITLVFSIGRDKGTVPALLSSNVWKEPQSQLEALQKIVRTLPVQVGDVYWKR